ncbi:hypothetical protein J2W68_002335 [Luteimonas terrae]|uniref:DUF2884 family protein n=2 Tax=Luteimonas terrae TaxID=1530191 RepID=A0ABU1XY34_9GAMM|nr:DUF2884 family protein [Luteimonas terrae]MDR7193598.1 hypothetical protein [Luteimonas terrae]
MRFSDAALAACLLIASMPVLAADDETATRLSSDQCEISTPYNVLVDTGGVWLYRDSGTPKEIFFHDGTLSVDRAVQTVSTADAARLRKLESGARTLMPQVTSVARESTDLAFDALAGVVEVMTGSARKVRQVERHRAATLGYIDTTLGTGRWDQDVFGEGFESRIEDAAERMTGSLGRSVMWQVFTGRAGRMDARAERMEADLDRKIEARSAALQAQADVLCTHVRELQSIQAALEYRLAGQRLVMLEDAPRSDGDASVSRTSLKP